jgi:hypothetical protein
MNGEMSVNTVMISESRMRELEYIEQHSEQIIRDVVRQIVQNPNLALPSPSPSPSVKRNRESTANPVSPAHRRMTRGR